MFEGEESYVMKYCLYFFGLCRCCNVPVDYGELEEEREIEREKEYLAKVPLPNSSTINNECFV